MHAAPPGAAESGGRSSDDPPRAVPVLDAVRRARVGRLTRPADFQAALRGRRIATSESFELWASRAPVPATRLGLAISKKSAPLAVTRNLVKRIARESARASAPLRPFDLVIRSRAGIGRRWMDAKAAKRTTPFRRALRTELDGLFAQVAV